jgi:hypothetical protein
LCHGVCEVIRERKRKTEGENKDAPMSSRDLDSFQYEFSEIIQYEQELFAISLSSSSAVTIISAALFRSG